MKVCYLNFRLRLYPCCFSLRLGDSLYMVRSEKYACCVRYLLNQGISRLRQAAQVYESVRSFGRHSNSMAHKLRTFPSQR